MNHLLLELDRIFESLGLAWPSYDTVNLLPSIVFHVALRFFRLGCIAFYWNCRSLLCSSQPLNFLAYLPSGILRCFGPKNSASTSAILERIVTDTIASLIEAYHGAVVWTLEDPRSEHAGEEAKSRYEVPFHLEIWKKSPMQWAYGSRKVSTKGCFRNIQGGVKTQSIVRSGGKLVDPCGLHFLQNLPKLM
ncbi:hypothetical protein VNO77_19511 [Canavalia gladiata]|uniref:Uncharacterized protein n=1 Tax=Canavalia gladiata TaxID=3824 RepID=A0AAN9LMS2_CANGL